MEPDLVQRLTALEEKTEKIFISVEKTRKYFQWTLIITVVTLVLPMIGLLFAVPYFMSTYVGGIQNAAGLIQ